MVASVTLDAYSESSIDGIVTSVSPTPTVTSNVVSYTAKILLPTIKKALYSNMTATVQITTAKKDNAIIIPISAVKSDKGKSYVQIVWWGNGNQWKREIELWITSGWSVEVLSWVTVWEKIINISMRSSSGSTNKWTTAQTPSLFWGPAGLWGGGGGGYGGGGGWRNWWF